MTAKRCLITTVFIAAVAIITGAKAENIYKCGSTYSQSPCPGAKVLSVDDSRDPRQKKLKDEVTRRDAELASDMEKTRLANEAALTAERAQQAKDAPKPTPTKEAAVEPVMVYAHKPRLLKPHKPEAFIAVVPGTVRKSGKSHKKLPEGTN